MTLHSGLLKCVRPTYFGSTLLLDNGHHVRLNLTPADITQFLANAGIAASNSDQPSPNLRVANPDLRMTAGEWTTIVSIIESSDAAAGIRATPELAYSLTLRFEELILMPHRLLGKIQEPNGNDVPTVWARHPFDFRGDSYDDNAIRFCHLYANGGHAFRTFIDIKSCDIRVKAFHRKGFFVEPQSGAAA